MSGEEQEQSIASHDARRVFEERFPNATLMSLSLSEIPKTVIDWSWPEVQQAFPEDKQASYYAVTDTVTDENGKLTTTYIAREVRRTRDGPEAIYLVDVQDGKAVGGGTLLFNSVLKKGGSYVAWTETAPDAQGEGLGVRRYRLARALSAAWFNVELGKSGIMTGPGKALAASLQRNRI